MTGLRRSLALVGVAALALSACSGSRTRIKAEKGSGTEIVEAEGMAPYNASDIPGSRAAALAAAQRAAVELVVGVYVQGRTRVDKAVAIEQKILAQTAGYVKRYEVLKEGPEGEWYKMRIRAQVSTERIHEELDSMSLLKRPEIAYPRVAILLQEYIGEKESRSGSAARALAQVLLNKGFKVMELPRSVDRDGDPIEVARGLSRQTAEILIAGLARSQPLETGGRLGSMSSHRATITGRLIETGTGEVLSTFSQVASGIEGTSEIAAQKAFEKTAELCADDVARLPMELSRRAQVNLSIIGLTSFETLSQFQKKLASSSGVKELFLRSYNQETGTVEMDVYIDMVSPQELAERAVQLGGESWTVLQVVGRSVRLNASPAGRS